MRNLFEDRMEENMVRYNNMGKEDVYRMNMEEGNNFIESKYKVNFDDISTDEEEEEDTLPKYIVFSFLQKSQQSRHNCKYHFSQQFQ